MKISPSQISVSSITLELLVCGLCRALLYATLCATSELLLVVFQELGMLMLHHFLLAFEERGAGMLLFGFDFESNQRRDGESTKIQAREPYRSAGCD